MIYAGIGSRETPEPVQDVISLIALKLAKRNWTLRSGGAQGADSAFYRGARIRSETPIEIYFPWKDFDEETETEHIKLTSPSPEATELAARYHPAWFKLPQGAKKLIARNSHQVFGADMNTPVDLIICYTEGGKLKGGTAQALRIAEDFKIPVYNLGNPLTYALISDIL